jgi:hypothetical protein
MHPYLIAIDGLSMPGYWFVRIGRSDTQMEVGSRLKACLTCEAEGKALGDFLIRPFSY